MIDTSSWAALEDTLARTLATLVDGQFLSVAAPAPLPPPTLPKRRLFGFRKPAADPVAYTQVLCMDDTLYTECVGSTSFGGRYPWTPEDESALGGLGWVHESHRFGEKVYALHIPREHAAQSARLMVATLRDVVRVGAPAQLDVDAG